MEQALGIVVFAVVILATLVAVATFAARSRAYDEIGKGGLYREDAPSERTSKEQADEEVRQMRTALQEHRSRHGG